MCSIFSPQEKASQQDEEVSSGELAFLLQPGEILLRVQAQTAAQPQRALGNESHSPGR